MSASVIQLRYRRYLLVANAKSELNHLRLSAIQKASQQKLTNSAATLIQSAFRMNYQQRQYHLMRASVCLLQAVWRRKQLVKHLALLRLEEQQRIQLRLELERAMAKKIIQWFVWKKTFANLHKLSCGLHACLVSIEFKMRQ